MRPTRMADGVVDWSEVSAGQTAQVEHPGLAERLGRGVAALRTGLVGRVEGELGLEEMSGRAYVSVDANWT